MKRTRAWSFHPVLPVIGTLLAIALACFGKLFLHPGEFLVGVQRGGLNDLVFWFLPRRDYPRLAFRQFGQLPFWCPWVGGGAPFLGSFQTALFYPPNWLFAIAPARGLISWIMVTHHALGALGAYLLSRRLGVCVLGCMFAAIAFGASPILLARTGEGHYATLCTVAWYPWAFLAYENLKQGRKCGWVEMAAVLALTFLAGHPQEFFYLVLTLSAVCVLETVLFLARGELRRGCALIARWGGAGLVAAALAAVELIPLAIYLLHASQEARLRSGIPLTPGWANCLQLISPMALGGPWA